MATVADYQPLYPDMDSAVLAVKHAAFAQGYAVYRSRTAREKRVKKDDPQGPMNRIELRCKWGGKSKAVGFRQNTELKTDCPFKVVVSLHKGMGEQWLLRVMDDRHNHPPSETLLGDPEYHEWFRTRTGGASELESLLLVARMSADQDPARPPPPARSHPVPLTVRAQKSLQSGKRSAASQEADELESQPRVP